LAPVNELLKSAEDSLTAASERVVSLESCLSESESNVLDLGVQLHALAEKHASLDASYIALPSNHVAQSSALVETSTSLLDMTKKYQDGCSAFETLKSSSEGSKDELVSTLIATQNKLGQTESDLLTTMKELEAITIVTKSFEDQLEAAKIERAN
jgi:chromosome segregation ATPase